MSPKLQLKFDANQEHQLQAVASVVRLFEGMPLFDEAFRVGDEVAANLPPDKERSLNVSLLFCFLSTHQPSL